MTPSSPLIKFRELMVRPRFIPALGIWDPYTARIAESLGMECVHIGGYQVGHPLRHERAAADAD